VAVRKAPTKPLRQALRDNAPWQPVQPTVHDCAALQALQMGKATPDQQKAALDWFINTASRYYDLSYRPGGHEGDRDTAFAEGRRFPGQQTVKMLKINVNALKTREEK
jgi:hypothetical protein